MRKLIISLLILALLPAYAFSEELNPAQIMEKYGNAVVLIATITNNEEIGQGSGFVVTGEGVIITNYHVIENSFPVLIKFRNGDVYEDVSVIDYNKRKDIAIIKIKGFDLPSVILGNSNNAKVGEKIVVIGNPKGLENTISDGLLSQVRDTGKGYKLFQISAPISAGSSGSPVFNSQGEVLGIASSGFSAEYGQNLNFAVPINYVRSSINDSVKYSMEEFVKLAKPKSAFDNIKTVEQVDNEKFVRLLNSGVTTFIGSLEKVLTGYDFMMEQKSKYNQSNYEVSATIYYSESELGKIIKELESVKSNDESLNDLKNIILKALKESYSECLGIIAALENKNYQGYYKPEWSKATAGIRIMETTGKHLDAEFLYKLVEGIKREAPEYEDEILESVLEIVEHKDKTEEEIFEEFKGLGRIGATFYDSIDRPMIFMIFPNSPAEKARLKRMDIILGIKDGVIFKTKSDFTKFQKTTKPGETYRFRIDRKGKEIIKKIKLEKISL